MSSFLRLTLFAVFGAAGLGLAICLAVTSEPVAEAITASDSLPAEMDHPPTNDSYPSGIEKPAALPAPLAKQAGPAADDQDSVADDQRVEPLTQIVLPDQFGVMPAVDSFLLQSAAAPRELALAELPGKPRQKTDVEQNPIELNSKLIHEFVDSLRAVLDRKMAPSGDADTARASNKKVVLQAPVKQAAQEAVLPGLPAPAKDQVTARVQRNEGDDNLTINIQDADIREVLDLISQQGGLNILASKSVTGRVSASLNDVDINTALHAVLRSTGFLARREGKFIYVGTAADFLDMDHAADKIGTRVYRPNYVTAKELQALILPMLTKSVGVATVSSPSQVGIPPDTVQAGGDDYAGAEVLLVRDYMTVLAQVDQVIDEVDIRPLQVAIEAMILSVKLDDSNKMGVDFEMLRNENNVRLISGSPLSTLTKIDVTKGGLKFGFLDSSLALFLSALETVGDTNVIASPRLMCLNKQRAEILIGSKLGYVTTTVTENAATQTVDFLEVGTQLRMRPFISRDGMIRMEIHPELSTGTVRLEGGFTLPDKDVTQVTTNIMCRDGCTVIIGGLIREDLTTNTTQIPLFGSLPLVGAVFRQKTETIDKNEIIVLITPHIVYEPKVCQDGDRAACEFHQRQALYADKMNPISKRSYGRRYYRLARAAWAEEDAYAALRYINMSIHFDPLSRAALNLRGQIIANSPYGDRTVDYHLREGLSVWNHPLHGHRLTNWVLDELEPGPSDLPLPPPMYDPGEPGPRHDIERPKPPGITGVR